MTDHQPRPVRCAGLDGMRAIAVLLVVVHHLFPTWIFAGGFIGVDVFFVISGFLITTLLLAEHARTGRIDLRAFWTRRARRLAPALALVVTVCASAAWLIGGDVLARMGVQILGAGTFSHNWLSIAGGSDYFAATNPELFRNLWSLAVEEQFYVVWPLTLPLLLLVRARWARVALPILVAVASAAWMASVVVDGGLTRAYFGTDTHAFGILVGVALALALERTPAAPARPSSPRARPVRGIGGVAALAALLVVGALPATDTPATFPGALLAASALTAVVLTAATRPGARLGRILDVGPLRWVGDRSFGLYLWHWPLLVLLSAGTTGAAPVEPPVGIGILTFVATFAAAELSYRFVETPVRRRGFRECARAAARALGGSPRRRVRALAVGAAALSALGGTSAAIAAAPARTSAESAVQAGADALGSDTQASVLSPTDGRDPVPVPTPATGNEITAIGDSVMVAAAPALMERFPGIRIDAAVSRSMYAGPALLDELAAQGLLRRYVIVALGTNGAIDRAILDELERIVGPGRDLVLVTAHAPRDWIPGVNAELHAFAADRAGVALADWSAAIAAREDLLAGDRIHPGSDGGRVFADTMAQAVSSAQDDRLERTSARYRLLHRLLDAR